MKTYNNLFNKTVPTRKPSGEAAMNVAADDGSAQKQIAQAYAGRRDVNTLIRK